MRVRLIYRKDLHTSEVGTLELDSPGPLVAVHTEDVSVQHSQRCLVYGLSYHCHEEKCKCGDGDKLLFTDCAVRTYGPETIESIAGIEKVDPSLVESVVGECYDERESVEPSLEPVGVIRTVMDEKGVEPDVPWINPVHPVVKSKSVKKRIAVQAKGRAKQ